MKDYKTPEPYSTIIDEVCAQDKAYFEAHPYDNKVIRLARAGELWPYQTPSGAMVEVTRIGPGVRGREFFFEGHTQPYPGCEYLCRMLDRIRAKSAAVADLDNR